jgi:glutamyl-tRNA reductase
VISTTGAAHPIVTDVDFTAIHTNRRGRPLLVLDLAVPRDFALSDERYSDVFLFTVDDLQQVCRRNAAERTRELPRALAIIDAETDRFLAEDRFRSAKPVVTQLTQAFSSVKEDELQRLLKKLSHLDAERQQEISRSFDRLTNKLVHRPLASLRAVSHDGAPAGLLESVTQLFRLKSA